MTSPARWQEIRDALGSLVQSGLDSIEAGSRVYTDMRWTDEEGQWEELFGNMDAETTTISAWFVTREGGRDIRGGSPQGAAARVPFGSMQRVHQVQIEGYLSYRFDGSSEQMFNDLVDALADQITRNFSASCTATVVMEPQWVQSLELFGPILCHKVVMTFEAAVVASATYS